MSAQRQHRPGDRRRWPACLRPVLLLGCAVLGGAGCAGTAPPAPRPDGRADTATLPPFADAAAPGDATRGDTDARVPEPPAPSYALDCARHPGLLHPLFGDRMVLQRDAFVPIWGCAAPGEQVSVSVAGQTVRAAADATGLWTLRLGPMPAGGPHALVVAATARRELADVLFGDVWLCSGQSNMHLAVSSALNAAQEIADAASHPTIRLFAVPTWGTPTPEQVFHPSATRPATWQRASAAAVPSFSAACYFFARELQKSVDVPMGLIQSSVGGTKIEHWISAAALAQDKDFAALVPGVQGIPPGTSTTSLKNLTLLFNGMIAPLRPFALRGALWYQGEANAGLPAQYKRLLPRLVDDWRSAFGLAELPFFVVQLPRYKEPQTVAVETGSWGGLREAQLQTSAKHPRVGLAVTIDTGMVAALLAACKTKRATCLAQPGAVATACATAYNSCMIHPQDKQDVGRRLALAAQSLIYGPAEVGRGPTVKSFKVQGNAIAIAFDHAASGLMAGTKAPLQAVQPDPTGKLRGFAVAGANKVFVAATAAIQGATVVVSAATVAQPAAVRYGWGNNPPCNLYNKDGLPASPFRTDTWPEL